MTPAAFHPPRPVGATRPVGALIATASIALLVLPFFSTFGELLTNAAMASGIDAALGQWTAPVEAQIVHGASPSWGCAAPRKAPCSRSATACGASRSTPRTAWADRR